MRLSGAWLVLLGLAAAVSGCVPVYSGPPGPIARVDPEDAGERALAGAALGSALGTGLGATFAINPAIGAVVGAESGAAIGAAVGVMTAQPLPSYKPIPVPTTAIIPEFYDTWPPGSHVPEIGTQLPPPPRSG